MEVAQLLGSGEPWQCQYAGALAFIFTEDMALLGFLLASDISATVRIEHRGGIAAWIMGTLVAKYVQGHRLPQLQELWPYQSLFLASWYLLIKGPLWLALGLPWWLRW